MGKSNQTPHFSGQRILANGLTHTEGLFYKLCIIFPAIVTSLLLFLTDIEDVVPEKYGGMIAMLTTMLTTISAFFVKFNVGQRREIHNNLQDTLAAAQHGASPRSNTALTVPVSHVIPSAPSNIDDIVNQLR